MKKILFLVAVLVGTLALADTLLRDEGVTVGPINRLNCVGDSIACTRSGATGTVTVSTPAPPTCADGEALTFSGGTYSCVGIPEASDPNNYDGADTFKYFHHWNALPNTSYNRFSLSKSGSSTANVYETIAGVTREAVPIITSTTVNTLGGYYCNATSCQAVMSRHPAWRGWLRLNETASLRSCFAVTTGNSSTACTTNFLATGLTGAMFTADVAVDASWRICSNPASAWTCTVTTVPVDLNWHHFEIYVTGTEGSYSYNFKIDGVLVGTQTAVGTGTTQQTPMIGVVNTTAVSVRGFTPGFTWGHY